MLLTGTVHADPADDGVAKLNELSRQAEQLTESMHSAQLDLDNKLQVQAAAEKKHADDVAQASMPPKDSWLPIRVRSTSLLQRSTWVAVLTV